MDGTDEDGTGADERPPLEVWESPEGTVRVEIGSDIGWLLFNRPEKRNAMNPALNAEMAQALDLLEGHEGARVVVLTGAGEAWSAWMDLKEYFRDVEASPPHVEIAARRTSAEWQWRRLIHFAKPTIAMVNGWCFGGAYGPMFACDLAFAAEEAQFGLSEINWGILPGGGASKVVRELLNFRRAMYHALTGESIDGRTAAQWGLVNEALPLEKLEARVTSVAKTLLKKNPVALKAAKDAIRRVGEMTYDNAEDYLVRAQEAANFFDNEGRKEGIHQFIDEKSFKPGLGAYDKSRRQTDQV